MAPEASTAVSDHAATTSPSEGVVRADAFVSYSRADEAFVRRLEAALRERGKDVWVDWDDIRPSADWRLKIYSGIESAKSFVAVLSSDLITSEVCREELEHAVESNKRIVPILHRGLDGREVPPELSAPNWIPFREADDFDRSLDVLIDTLETDLDWLDDHARLLVRAHEWEREGRDPSFLLRGRDLKEAEAWLAQQGSHREAATPLQAEYVVAGRRAAVRRQRISFGAVALALAVSIGLGILALLQRNDAIAQSKVSRSRELAAAAISQLPSDPELGVLLTREALRANETDEAKNALRRSLRESHIRLRLDRHPAARVAYSPGGKLVVAAGRDGIARVFDARTGREVATLAGSRRPLTDAVFSPDGTRIATAGSDGVVRLWYVRGRRVAELRGHRRGVVYLAFTGDGARLVTGDEDGTVRAWDALRGRRLRSLSGPQSGIEGVAASADGRRIAATSHDGALRVWDARTGRRVAAIPVNTQVEPAYSPSLTPNGGFVAAATWDDGGVWRTATGRRLMLLTGHEQPPLEIYVLATRFSRDGRLLVSAGIDGTARIWVTGAPRSIAVHRGHTGPVLDAAFSRSGTRVVSTDDAGTTHVWDSLTGDTVAVLGVPRGLIRHAVLAPDENHVVTASPDGVRIWETSSTRPLRRIVSPVDPPRDFQFYLDRVVPSPDGRTLATRSNRPAWRLWDFATGRLLARLPGQEALAFSPDGAHVVTVAQGPTARIWASRTGERLAILRGHRGRIVTAVFGVDGGSVLTASVDGTVRTWSPNGQPLRTLRVAKPDLSGTDQLPAVFSADGRRLVARRESGALRVWDVPTGKVVSQLRGSDDSSLDMAFDRTGRLVAAAGGFDGTRADVWDAATGERVAVLRGAITRISRLVFNPDGRAVLGRSGDDAFLWNAETGALIVRFRGHGVTNTGAVESATFSPDGRLVLTSGGDGTAKLWDAASGEQFSVLRGTTLGWNVPDAAISADGRFVAMVSGPSAFVYECEECASFERLRRLAPARVTRGLTRAERRRFLHED